MRINFKEHLKALTLVMNEKKRFRFEIRDHHGYILI